MCCNIVRYANSSFVADRLKAAADPELVQTLPQCLAPLGLTDVCALSSENCIDRRIQDKLFILREFSNEALKWTATVHLANLELPIRQSFGFAATISALTHCASLLAPSYGPVVADGWASRDLTPHPDPQRPPRPLPPPSPIYLARLAVIAYRRSVIMRGMGSSAAVLLHRARCMAGLSQRELADRAGVSQPVISAYERGRREPSLSTLARLVAATGCELTIKVEHPDAFDAPALVEFARVESPLRQRVRERRDTILAIAAARHARNLRLFGSVARGAENASSDVDLLVNLDEGVSLVDLIGLERELSDLLGCEVDVVPARSLKPGIAKRVLAEATPL